MMSFVVKIHDIMYDKLHEIIYDTVHDVIHDILCNIIPCAHKILHMILKGDISLYIV
jgi:hypothetical protein